MATPQPLHIKSISAFHRHWNLPMPGHPLISVVNFDDMTHHNGRENERLIEDFYCIALKRSVNTRMYYGQQEYDFEAGIMSFVAPGQIISVRGEARYRHSGLMLLVHPDFIWNTPLAAKMRHYEFFGYAVHEALHLSDREEQIIIGLMRNMQQEYETNMDNFSQDVVIAQLELLLTYAERFYHRQFLTRKISNHQVLERLENLLDEYMRSDKPATQGLPTVQQVSEALNMSAGYLSGVLRVLTGKSTQHHIHDKLIERAKEQLSTTRLTVSEISFALGFEHPQSFSKMFKTRTRQSPLAFRQSFSRP